MNRVYLQSVARVKKQGDTLYIASEGEGMVDEKRLVTAAGDRYGIRYSEALCLEAAYQRRRADRLEARTEILEKRVEELRALIAECSTTGYTVS